MTFFILSENQKAWSSSGKKKVRQGQDKKSQKLEYSGKGLKYLFCEEESGLTGEIVTGHHLEPVEMGNQEFNIYPGMFFFFFYQCLN